MHFKLDKHEMRCNLPRIMCDVNLTRSRCTAN
jgi:hypothetical protein